MSDAMQGMLIWLVVFGSMGGAAVAVLLIVLWLPVLARWMDKR